LSYLAVVTDSSSLQARFERLDPFMDERSRRLFAATEALAFGYGGVTTVATVTGIARSTINRGITELKDGANKIGRRQRKPGGGRWSAEKVHPELLAAIEELADGAIRGDPESVLRWISRSQRNIVTALCEQGFTH
jgi:hypothetical protein